MKNAWTRTTWCGGTCSSSCASPGRRGRFRDRSQHLVLEQRILDAAGVQVARVTEWSPRLGLTLGQYVPREESICGVVYDHNDAKSLEFVASDGLRRRRFFKALNVGDDASR
jgi:hypothetical protein